MNTALNATFWEYITDKANLPLLIVLAAIVVAILVLVIVMIVLSVKAKKRSRLEAEEAVRALANVPPDEEYTPVTAAASASAQEEAEESAESPSSEPLAEPIAEPAEETETPAGSAEPLQIKEEETEMAEKKQPTPVKKDVKKPEPKKAEPVKKDVKKPEPKKAEPVKSEAKKPEPKKAEPAKVSAANGKWVIETVKGKYWLSLIAPNGQVMLESPTPYASLSSARSGIKTYQDNIAADRLEITEHKNGDSQVQVLTAGGRLLATSSTYSSRSQADSAKESIKRWASTTAVEEVPEK